MSDGEKRIRARVRLKSASERRTGEVSRSDDDRPRLFSTCSETTLASRALAAVQHSPDTHTGTLIPRPRLAVERLPPRAAAFILLLGDSGTGDSHHTWQRSALVPRME